MNKHTAILIAALVATYTLPAQAGGGDAAQGEAKSKPCQACHGPDGNSPTPNFPKIAGQYEDYIVNTLMGYKSGARKNPIMAGMAAPLSEQDIHDLAAYYARQNGLLKLDLSAQ